MFIRDYQSKDFLQVEALWKACSVYSSERGDSAEIIDRCTGQGGKLLVMEDPANGKIIATSWLTWDGRRMLMHHFAVRPSYQNKGYGRRLALKSLEFAREKGAPVKLEVSPLNIPATKLYKSLGFELLGDYDVYMLKQA